MAEHNLGDLSRLPGEIRKKIWQELRPSKGTSCYYDHETRPPRTIKEELLYRRYTQQDCCYRWFDEQQTESLGILRAGRQLSEEILFELYDKEALDIQIHSDMFNWTVKDGTGATWNVRSSRHPFREALSKLPFKKLKSIKITVDATERGNKAQFLRLIQNARELATLLEQAEGLPPLMICLLDTDFGQWHRLRDGMPRYTIVWSYDETDYRLVLMQFGRLRFIESAILELPSAAKRFPAKDDAWQRGLLEVLTRKEPFGSFKTEQDEDDLIDGRAIEEICCDIVHNEKDDCYWDDKIIQRRLDTSYADHESILDSLSGRDADMMRLERFMYWYKPTGESDYLKRWESICTCKPSESFRISGLSYRHDFLMSFNPLSRGMQRVRFQMDLPPSQRYWSQQVAMIWSMPQCLRYISAVDEYLKKGRCSYLNSENDTKELGVESWWSEEAWKNYYPEGIPPLISSDEMMEVVIEVDEEDRHEEGMKSSEIPVGWDRIRAQTKLINFNATGDEIYDALDIHFETLRDPQRKSRTALSPFNCLEDKSRVMPES